MAKGDPYGSKPFEIQISDLGEVQPPDFKYDPTPDFKYDPTTGRLSVTPVATPRGELRAQAFRLALDLLTTNSPSGFGPPPTAKVIAAAAEIEEYLLNGAAKG